MIKRALIKNIPLKRLKKLARQKLKKTTKEFKSLCCFLTYVYWLKQKTTLNVDGVFNMLVTENIFSNLKAFLNNEEVQQKICSWFIEKDNDTNVIKSAFEQSLIMQNAKNDAEKDIIINAILIYFNCPKIKENLISKTDLYSRYLNIHKNIFNISRENYSENLNEIMVLLNLTTGVFND